MVASRRRSKAGAGEAGHVLVFALVVVVILTIALSLVALLVSEHQRALNREIRAIRLTALADAALALTLAELALDPGFGGLSRSPFGQGEIESEVEPLSPAEAEVVCRATWRGHTRVTRARVALGPRGPRVVEWWVERGAGPSASAQP